MVCRRSATGLVTAPSTVLALLLLSRLTATSMMTLPFFATADLGSDRRLLLISHHFPPSGAVGALRWQKLSRYFAASGWGLDVITMHPAEIERRDDRRLLDLPPGVRCYLVAQPEPPLDRGVAASWFWIKRRLNLERGKRETESLTRKQAVNGRRETRDLIRAYYAWREYARGESWARRAAALAGAIVIPGLHQAVVTCGPPHMAHEAGRLARLKTGLPLVVDLRDPWWLLERLPEPVASPVWYFLARRYERRVMKEASLIVMNTEPARRAMASAYPALSGRVVAVTNGCDEDEPLPLVERGPRFVIAYAGTIYLDRDPLPLLQAAARVIRETGATPDEFGVEFMGAVESHNGQSVSFMAQDLGIGSYVRLHPPRFRQEAQKFMAGAAVLVILPQDSELAIPGKVFEYLRFDAWLLALANPDSATGLLLQDSGADVVAPGDAGRLHSVVRRRFEQYRLGLRPVRPTGLERLSRREQAWKLISMIGELTSET